jgi:hypothetical protein
MGLYIHSPILIHGVVLEFIILGTILLFWVCIIVCLLYYLRSILCLRSILLCCLRFIVLCCIIVLCRFIDFVCTRVGLLLSGANQIAVNK